MVVLSRRDIASNVMCRIWQRKFLQLQRRVPTKLLEIVISYLILPQKFEINVRSLLKTHHVAK